nr:hypothetical protein CFP56_62735 [Quercus suber]
MEKMVYGTVSMFQTPRFHPVVDRAWSPRGTVVDRKAKAEMRSSREAHAPSSPLYLTSPVSMPQSATSLHSPIEAPRDAYRVQVLTAACWSDNTRVVRTVAKRNYDPSANPSLRPVDVITERAAATSAISKLAAVVLQSSTTSPGIPSCH